MPLEAPRLRALERDLEAVLGHAHLAFGRRAVVDGDEDGQDARRALLRPDGQVADDVAALPAGALGHDGQVEHRLAGQHPREQGADRRGGVREHLLHPAPEVLGDAQAVHRGERRVDVDVAVLRVDEPHADRRAVERGEDVGGGEDGGHGDRCTSRAPACARGSRSMRAMVTFAGRVTA